MTSPDAYVITQARDQPTLDEFGAVSTSGPTGSARTVAKLHWLTSDKLPELYLVLAPDRQPRQHVGEAPRAGAPQRPHRLGPQLRARRVPRHPPYLVVNRHTLRAAPLQDGRVIFSAPARLGRPSPTPGGHFWVVEKFRVRGAPAYGPLAVGTSAYSPHLTDWPGGGVIGLHGTNEPGLVPGRPSHGCIRLHNSDIVRLYRLVPRGTPIHIHD